MFKKIAFLATSVLALTTTTQAVAADSLLERLNHKGTITVGKLTGYDVEVTRAVG